MGRKFRTQRAIEAGTIEAIQRAVASGIQKSTIARTYGVSRMTVYRLIDRYGLRGSPAERCGGCGGLIVVRPCLLCRAKLAPKATRRRR